MAIHSRTIAWKIPWTAACQASLSFTVSQSCYQGSLSFIISQSFLKLMSIVLVMPSNHLILCHPLLLLPSIFPSIRVFSNESTVSIRWPKFLLLQHQTFLRVFIVDFLKDQLVWSPCFPRDSTESSPAPVWKHQFFGAQPSLWSHSHIHAWLLEKP